MKLKKFNQNFDNLTKIVMKLIWDETKMRLITHTIVIANQMEIKKIYTRIFIQSLFMQRKSRFFLLVFQIL